MKVIITFTFCCNNVSKSKFMALEKPGKLREFFVLLCEGVVLPCEGVDHHAYLAS